MLGKQCLIKPVQSRLNRLYLNKDIDTVAILFHHLLHTANLTFDAAQPINQIPVFLTFCALSFLLASSFPCFLLIVIPLLPKLEYPYPVPVYIHTTMTTSVCQVAFPIFPKGLNLIALSG